MFVRNRKSCPFLEKMLSKTAEGLPRYRRVAITSSNRASKADSRALNARKCLSHVVKMLSKIKSKKPVLDKSGHN